jgi:hypothetical protein
VVVDSNRFKFFANFFVDNVPVAENWMLGMCDVTDCINDGRDPETIRFFGISKILNLKLRLSSLLLNPFIL